MRVLVYEGPRKLRVTEAEDMPLKEGELRIKTLFSGVSHGTEMNIYRGIAPFYRRKYDGKLRLFTPAEKNEVWSFPVRSCDPGVWYMGYSNVGEVVEIGDSVTGFNKGDLVYSDGPHQSQVIKPASSVIKLPGNIKPEYGVFFANLMTAYNGLLDTNIKLGDNVAVFGLGVLGQLLVQMVKMSGAFNTYGIDLIEKRLETALGNGASNVFNSKTCSDVAYEIRLLTNNKGVDAVIEVTGNSKALNEAIRVAAPDTTVTALGWYQGGCNNLDLSEEFHHNRIRIKSSQTGGIDPQIMNMWNHQRRVKTCLDLLGILSLENLISHRVPYENAPEAYQMIDEHPDNAIQVVFTY